MKIDSNQFTFSAVMMIPSSGVAVSIIARSIPELEYTWDIIANGMLSLDKSRIQRVDISAKKEDTQ